MCVCEYKNKSNMNNPTPWLVEVLFLFSSSISIFYRSLAVAPLLASIYLLFLFAYAIGCIKLRPPDPIMFQSPLCIFNLFIFCTLLLSGFANPQNTTSTPATTSFRPIFTVPASADVGMFCLSEKSEFLFANDFTYYPSTGGFTG